MTCREIADSSMQYTDGELPVWRRAAFQMHLAWCPACRNYLNSYRTTVALTRLSASRDEVEVPAVADELVQAILTSRRDLRTDA